MTLVNAAFDRLLDVLLIPFTALPPAIGLIWLGLLTAAGVLAVVRRVSDQAAIERVKRRLQASLFEIRLFNDDPRAIFRAQKDILRNNATYLRLSAAPMLWVIPILLPVMVHLDARYGYRSIEAGKAALVGVTLAARAPELERMRPSIDIQLPEGIGASPPSVWVPEERRMVWRLDVPVPGSFDVEFGVDGRQYAKRLQVDAGVVPLALERARGGLWQQLWNPGEAPLPPEGAIEKVNVEYPTRRIGVGLWSAHWMVVYLVATLVWVLVLRRWFGVTL